MFQNDELQNHLETSSTIRIESFVTAEWNMNVAENIARIGNYRYRPTDPETSKYFRVAESFEYNDEGSMFYTGATDADVIVDGGFDDNNVPIAFISKKEKEKMLYSLEDCFGRFRPRSGINKLRYFSDKYSHHDNRLMSQRPRYYMADKKDPFKYWSSFRTEDGIERGIADTVVNGRYYISDAAPFVVYKNKIPANRIVVKMQTSVGSVDLGPFSDSSGAFNDPFFGEENKTTPVRWKIQYLKDSNWVDAIRFDENSTRRDGSPIIGSDGYLEIGYGLIIPDEYYNIFNFEKVLASESLLPPASEMVNGVAFLIINNSSSKGVVHIAMNGQYETFNASYGWQIIDEINRSVSFVENLTNPEYFVENNSNEKIYRELAYIQGLRVVAETMNKIESSLDLIELSPRLSANISDKINQFSITKPASDLGVSGMPVGQLLVSTGTLDIFDYDQAFFDTNTNSIVKDYTNQSIQFKFYETVLGVNGSDYFVPIKTMYADGFPSINNQSRTASITLRDLFFYLESSAAPTILLESASLSYAVSLLLDSIGFSNYVFLRTENEAEDVIPYFYIEPDKSVAEILNSIARSTQSAMFFDEYNNLIVMSKNYMMPSTTERGTDLTLYGSKDFAQNGAIKNQGTSNKLSNIVNITSQDNRIYNDGKILYSTRYIQRSYASIRQASLLDRDKTWIYKPALLWEVSATENTKSVNEEVNEQSAYALAAIPLNSDLNTKLPKVVNHQLVNNIIDLGDGIYWLTRYNGYLYANGEIIKFDAVQYNIPGLSATEKTETGDDNVWISSRKEYQRYFEKVPFNGKIYPTGILRIYSEPNYETAGDTVRLKNGDVAKHGRGQFGTEIVEHSSGISSHWTDDNNVRGALMESKYLFGDTKVFKTVSSVELISNDPVALFSVSDPSVLRPGDYIERYDEEEYEGVEISANIIQENTQVTGVDVENKQIVVDKPVLIESEEQTPIVALRVFTQIPATVTGAAGIDNARAQQTNRTDLIRNFLAKKSVSELPGAQEYPATTQSSALVMEGAFPTDNISPTDFVSYVYKPLENRFRHFGTRLRIVGQINDNDIRGQSPEGASTYFTVTDARGSRDVSISGSSAGIAIMVNPETNNGYFFELAGLSVAKNLSNYQSDENVADMIFYKVLKRDGAENDNEKAIPVPLWRGIGNILVDSGDFVGQQRLAVEAETTVYDIAIEYEELGNTRRFYLYVNNVLVGIADDEEPLPIYSNMALFIRGSSKAMFEHVYALTKNYSQNATFSLETPASDVFEIEDLNANQSFRKYAVSGFVQSTFLSGIGPDQPPKYNIYYDEFGTIMREAAYFNVRYDKAYPALSAEISPTFNRIKGYSVSGFRASSYGAEFLIFNNTDSALNLDSTSGNYLRIQGVTFTQQSKNELTVDEYFEKIGNLSDPEILDNNVIVSPEVAEERYRDIKLSRITHGRTEFSIDAPYIQSQDSANGLMKWMTEKVMKKRKSVGLQIFAMPTLQLGDIVTINYVNELGTPEISSSDSRFVVYYIEYNRGPQGPTMNVYLSEVI